MRQQSINKLIIDIDGFTYSHRLPLLMALESAVLKIAAFEDIGSILARPWEHYIPVKMDLSDLEEKILWAKEHDDELHSIAKRGKEFAYRSQKP